MTITPTREDAAAVVILLPVGGDAYLLTGSGERQSRFEFLRAEVPLGDTLAAMVEAVVAGRIEDDVTFGRDGRVVRQRTVIELADGTEMPVTAGHQVLGCGSGASRSIRYASAPPSGEVAEEAAVALDQHAVGVDLAALAQVAHEIPVQRALVGAAGDRVRGAERHVHRAADLLVEQRVERRGRGSPR